MPVHPTTLVIFGGTGDLAHRKLLPAIYNLAHEGALPGALQPDRGVALRDVRTTSTARWRASRSSSTRAASRTRRCSRSCSSRCATCPGTFDDDSVFERLERGARAVRRARRRSPFNRIFYLSTAPSFFALIVEQARRARARQARRRRGARGDREAVRHARVGGEGAEPPGPVGAATSRRSTGSTTTWGRRRSRTSWRSGSRTACSSRSGTATSSTTSRSRRPRTSGIGRRAEYYDSVGRAARPRPEPHAPAADAAVHGAARDVRRRRGARREGQGAPRRGAAVRGRGRAGALHGRDGRGQGGGRLPRRGGRAGRLRRPRPTSRSGSRWTTGAGPACRSTCAPASGSPARSPRSP